METATPSDWYVPIIVLGIIVLILAFSGRPKTDTDIDETEEPLSGTDLIDRLQRTLRIGIVIESVEPALSGDSVTVRAALMYGSRATEVVATGESEAAAWKDLARAAIAWRNADYQHIPMWPGGG